MGMRILKTNNNKTTFIMKRLLSLFLLSLPAALTLTAGNIVTDTIHSKVLGADVCYNVYLPSGFGKQADARYPVVYLLHGLSDDYRAWRDKGQMQSVADELIESGEACKMVIIMPGAGGPDIHNTWNGYFNMPGWAYEDFFFTELYNVLDNIPQTLLLILISYVMKPGVSTIIFALCLTGWLGMARFIRNQIIIIRDRDYNLASRCLGVPTWRIIVKNLLPYLVSVITMRMALAIPSAIGNEVFVTYIGIGLPVDTPSLGNLIQTGRSLMTVASLRYQLFFPVLVLVLITTSFYIIGNAFADAADPKNHVK